MKYNQDQRHFCEDGFTLIEVLIVIAIFSIGILGAMSMQIKAVTTNAHSNKVTLALEYATDTMERLMQVGTGTQDQFNVDDDDDGIIDEINESELNNDGIDNDNDGTIDEADELEWFRRPFFQVGTGYTRGPLITSPIPLDAYYASIFNLSWSITDIDCDGDGTNDAKRIDMLVTWDGGRKRLPLSNIRANMM